MPESDEAAKPRPGRGVMRFRHASILCWAFLLALLCASVQVRAETCEDKGLVGQCKCVWIDRPSTFSTSSETSPQTTLFPAPPTPANSLTLFRSGKKTHKQWLRVLLLQRERLCPRLASRVRLRPLDSGGRRVIRRGRRRHLAGADDVCELLVRGRGVLRERFTLRSHAGEAAGSKSGADEQPK